MPPRGTNHRSFAQGFVHVALLSALTAGFGVASYMASHLGLGLPLAAVWPAIVQVHGNTQLAGWIGLFIMGMSLHVVPRLSGVPLRMPGLATLIWMVMAGSLVWRAIAQPLLMLGVGGPFVAVAMMMAGLAQMLAVTTYVGLLIASLRVARIDPFTHPKIGPLRPMLLLSLVSWQLFGLTMGGATVLAGLRGVGLLDPGLHLLAADLFIAGVLVPVAFTFSLRLFPLYLQIEPAQWNPAPLTLLYTMATVLEVGARLAGHVSDDADALSTISALGLGLRSIAILLFIVGLGLHRRRVPLGDWKPELHGAPRFGQYRPLLLGAYALLGIGALLQMGLAVTSLTGAEPWLQPAGVRHAFVAGFGTLLILGVAPRMVSGLFGARGPALPHLVGYSAWLSIPAALAVTAYLSTPVDAGLPLRGVLFGIAGPMMWLSIALLAANLWVTGFRTLD